MGYCTVADVQAHRPHHPITADSRPSIADVQAEIDRLSADVDGQLSAVGFLVPIISGPQSLNYLKAMVSYGVAAIAEVQQRAAIGEGETMPRSFYWSLYERMLGMIVGGGLGGVQGGGEQDILGDAPMIPIEGGSGYQVLTSFFIRNPSDDPQTGQRSKLTGTAVPRFEIRKEF
jgi:hypothetical protein